MGYSQSSLIHLVGPSDCTLHGFVHGGEEGQLAGPLLSPWEVVSLLDPVEALVSNEARMETSKRLHNKLLKPSRRLFLKLK